jgi:hypothetical protein
MKIRVAWCSPAKSAARKAQLLSQNASRRSYFTLGTPISHILHQTLRNFVLDKKMLLFGPHQTTRMRTSHTQKIPAGLRLLLQANSAFEKTKFQLLMERGLEIREYGRGDSLRWTRDILYPQTLAQTSLASGGPLVSIHFALISRPKCLV